MTECTHLDQIRNVKPHTRGCEECLKIDLGSSAPMHDVRPCRMLRLVQE